MAKKHDIAIIGAGNLGIAIAKGIAGAKLAKPKNMYLTRRHLEKLADLKKQKFNVLANNIEAVQNAEYVFLCVQPKQLPDVLKEINPVLDPEKHVLISTITGVEIPTIEQHLETTMPIIRAMPNTATAIQESMTCMCTKNASEDQVKEVKTFFEALGETLVIDENLMKAATVLAASGIAFFLRYIRAATQGGIQLGFHAEEAQKIAMQTARGAASLLVEGENHPETEIDKVTTPQGCTIAGLNEMEHQGLSSAVIKGLMASYEKINNITQ
ncbi:pyrroline-5-carboxylate reductase [Gracilimonas mengyeensis]|uniref:Pyrroline-5-carboxylate reductase n=1 Tax=Gracilimonas mengyeensis TaxID=1302730 RepID=A0A521CF16_9BACT|nr:pyrroline-5-carboxylate reductase [Gracilimonas mengyeensis]SMO57361.1 pyrroline-5-carboxylate reductase [Gracilimonas mengyeensis]